MVVTMKVTLSTNGSVQLFIAESTYAEKDVPKAAGFRFCPGNCAARWKCRRCFGATSVLPKVWWTDKPEIAARLVEFADDAAKAALQPTVATVEASRAETSDFQIPVNEGLAYRPFQNAGVAYMDAAHQRFPGVINADDMGLGKTIQIAGLINARPEAKAILIVCPQGLRINWQRELTKWLVRPTRIFVVLGADDFPPADAEIVIVNYEKLVGKPGKIMLPALMARSWDLMIADEAQALKNPEAQRTVAVLGREDDPAAPGLVSKTKKAVYLTGTPIENRPIEFHGLLKACAPQEFPFWHYAKRYCGAFKERHGWNFSGASNLEELQVRLRATVMVRRLKSEVLKELPSKQRQVIVLARNGAAGAIDDENSAYAPFEEEIAEIQAEMEVAEAAGDDAAYNAAVARLSMATKVAFTKMAAVRHEVAMQKVPYVVEHLQTMLESGVKKVVVFAHHHDVMDAIVAEFGSAAVQFSGRNNATEKQEAVDRFQTDASVRVFVGQITAAGVGITLTAASNVVFAELDWVPGKVTQAEDRCNRMGQTESVLVQHLVFDGSIDARMAQVLVEKQDIQDRALDNPDRDFKGMVEKAAEEAAKAAAAKKVGVQGAPRFPVATIEERAAAKLAMQMLAGACDGARKIDGAGFNKLDAAIGKKLAERTRDFTDGEVSLSKKLARFYRRQLPDVILGKLGVGV